MPIIGDLGDIHMESGVSEATGEPFVQVRATGQYLHTTVAPADDTVVVLVGQLSPDELRAHALAYLEAAEAAEQDSLVFAEVTTTLDLSPDIAAAFLVALRARREAR